MPTRHTNPLAHSLGRDVARRCNALRGAALLKDGGKQFVSHGAILTNGKNGKQEESKKTPAGESCYALDMAEKAKNPAAVALGLRIKQRREEIGWSQPVLARNLGVTNGAVGAWEVGLKSPRRQMAHKLAHLLGVSMDWLLTGNEPEEVRKAQTMAEAEAIALIRSLAPDKQEAALAMLRGLASPPITK